MIHPVCHTDISSEISPNAESLQIKESDVKLGCKIADFKFKKTPYKHEEDEKEEKYHIRIKEKNSIAFPNWRGALESC